MSTHTIVSPTTSLSKSSSVVGVGNSNVVTAVTDALDTTYVHGTGTSATQSVTYDVANLTLAANQRAVGLRCKIRTARDLAGGSTQDTSTWLVQWPNTSHKSAVLLVQRGSNTILTYAGPLIKTPPGKTTEWTNADLAKVAMTTQWAQPHTGTKNVFQRVYELSVDVEFLTQAVVTGAPVVTNFTSNAKPNVAWVFNDPDGEEQQAYRVKIFDAATVATGNFSPDTSAATWDSGDVHSDTINADVAVALQNGVTYTAYVRVAKLGPVLPNVSPLWWSPWAASAPFTVTFTPPIAPTITGLAALVEESSYRAVMDVNTFVNLLSADDASFETSIGTWVNLANATVVRDTAQSADGGASMKLTSIAAGVMSARTGDPAMRVDYNQTYTALASFRTAVTGRTVQVGVQWLRQDASTIISTVYGTGATDTSGGFTQVTFTGVAPLGAKYARATVQISTPAAASEVHWVDKIDVHAGSGTSWTPGGYTNDQGGLVLQRQEFLDDSRGPAYNWFSEQVASCGAVTRSTFPGFQWNSTNTDLEWLWLDVALGQPGYTGAGMLRWQVVATGAGGTVLAFGWDFYNLTTAYSPPIVPGQSHTLSAWLWCDVGTRVLSFGIQWRDVNGNTTTNSQATITVTTTPQKFQITATAPASGSVYASGFLIDNVGTPGPHVFMARLGFGLGVNTVGNFQPVGLTTHEWHDVQFTGEANTLDANVPTTPQPPGYATGNIETFADYELPAGRPVSYRVALIVSSNALVLTSAYGYSPIVYAAPPTRTVIRSVTDPTLSSVVNRRKTMSYAFSDDAQVFHPLGADAAPIKVRDWHSGEDGTIDIVISTEAQYQRVRRLLSSNDVLVIQWAQGGRSYVVVTGVSLSETLSTDVDWCDANGDGTQDHIRYVVASISYLETVSPSTFVTI